MFKTILVAVDGSDHSAKAIDVACDLADKYDGKVVVVSVYKTIRVPDSTHALIRPQLSTEPPSGTRRQTAQHVVDAAAERVRERGLPASQVETVVKQGQPARTIVKEAKDRGADAIVIGSRGLGDMSGFLLGSVSHKVSNLAECTCIMVK